MLVRFNRNPAKVTGSITQPTTAVIKQTPQLWNASLEDALLYGGDLTRTALGAMNIRGDKKHVIVDSKVHMLMPGMFPAIPGWHNDGTPRGEGGVNTKAAPNFQLQEQLSDVRYHLLVTGTGSLTHFMSGPLDIEVENLDPKAYEKITSRVNAEAKAYPNNVWTPPNTESRAHVVEWDWWNMHAAWAAERHEWRYLIRVLETDHDAPQTDLRNIIRTQQQVYVPQVFGW